jgi:ClpP class serine protease
MALAPFGAAMLLDDAPTQSPAQAAPTRRSRPYAVAGRVAIVPVRGLLIHGAVPWWMGEATGYGDIRGCLAVAVADPEIDAIVLHINSPGGDVAGCFDLADAIYRMRGRKPLWAILDENALSAAYALASACERIAVPRTGSVGSIGCIELHADITGALDQAGIKITTVQFGARKSEGYPTTPMNSESLQRAQAVVDKFGKLFVSIVARNRKLSAAAIRATEAGIFMGAAGVAAGLADEVLSPDHAFLALMGAL